jgi:hypothetical protein
LLAMIFSGLKPKSATNVLNQSELKTYWQVKETRILQHDDRLREASIIKTPADFSESSCANT